LLHQASISLSFASVDASGVTFVMFCIMGVLPKGSAVIICHSHAHVTHV
jgi:hypothetical protein